MPAVGLGGFTKLVPIEDRKYTGAKKVVASAPAASAVEAASAGVPFDKPSDPREA